VDDQFSKKNSHFGSMNIFFLPPRSQRFGRISNLRGKGKALQLGKVRGEGISNLMEKYRGPLCH